MVDLFYQNSGAWGLRGIVAGAAIFQLGSVNQIAAWAFTSTRLSATLSGVTTALVAGETLGTYGAFRGLLVESGGTPRVLVGDVALPADLAYTPTDRTASIANAGFEGVTGSASATGSGAPDVSVTSGSWTLRAQGVGVAEGQTGTVRTGSRALRLYAPKPTIGDGFGYVPGSYTSTASQEFSLAAGGDAGRVHRLTMWVRSDGGGIRPWLAGGVAIQARVAGVLVDVASRVWADIAFTSGAWRLVTMDVRVPVGATALLVALTATSSSDASAPASVVVYADDLALSVFDRSVSIVSPNGFATFASPLSSFRASDAGVEMAAVEVQTLGLRLLDAGTAASPPDGQATVFKRGRDLVVRFSDGSEKRVQLV